MFIPDYCYDTSFNKSISVQSVCLFVLITDARTNWMCTVYFCINKDMSCALSDDPKAFD